jgi:site-specific DNA-methyltransferase (adenine-specific)
MSWAEGDRCAVRREGVAHVGTITALSETSACVAISEWRNVFCGVDELEPLEEEVTHGAPGECPELGEEKEAESTNDVQLNIDGDALGASAPGVVLRAVRIERGRDWTMLLGDALNVAMSVGPVDHVITDPPYEAESHTKARRSLKDATQRRGAENRGEVRRIDEALENDFAQISEADRAAAARVFAFLARRWVLAFCQIEAVGAWRDAFVSAGLKWARGCVWHKPDGAPQFTGDRPGQGFECLAVAHRRGRKRWNGGGKHGVWTCPLGHGRGNGQRNLHPTTKPVRLMMELVTDFTDAGESILDPFAGSGTTGVAAVRLGRTFIGIERQEKYFELACERLRAEESLTTREAEARGQVPLFGVG